jgi:hypothetical protein
MSAFQCSDSHLNAMLHYFRSTGGRMHNALRLYAYGKSVELGPWHEDATWIKAMMILYDENLRSLNARYKDSEPDAPFAPRSYVYNFGVQPLSAVEAIKACQCYDYQACETNDYEQTFARSLTKQIEDHAISRLPGWDAAPWGADASFDRFQRKGAATLIVLRHK